MDNRGGLRRLGAAMLAASANLGARAAAPQDTPAAPWLAVVPDLLCTLAALVVAAVGATLVWRAVADPGPEGFSVRSHGGGFGGAGAGWRASAPLVRLLAGLVLVALAIALAVARVPVTVSPAGGSGRSGTAGSGEGTVPAGPEGHAAPGAGESRPGAGAEAGAAPSAARPAASAGAH